MTKPSYKQTAAQRMFAMYVKEISNKVIKKFAPSFVTYEDMKNKWRYELVYSEAIEEYIILKTRIYIMTLDSRDPTSKNPSFLKALTKLMADFLSRYTMRAPNCVNRKKAKEVLNKKLFEEFPYIINIISRIELKKELRDKSKRNTYKRPARLKQKQQLENAAKRFNNARSRNSQIVSDNSKRR